MKNRACQERKARLGFALIFGADLARAVCFRDRRQIDDDLWQLKFA
jgi:hypothetical protein